MATFVPVQLDETGDLNYGRNYKHISTSGTVYTFQLYNGTVPDGALANTYITYDSSDKKWRDVGTDHPATFAVSSTSSYTNSGHSDPSVATGTANAEYIHCVRNGGALHLLTFKMAGWSTSGAGTLATITWTPSFVDQGVGYIKATITGTPSSSFPLTAQKDFKLYKLTNGVQTQVSTTVQFLNNTTTMTQFRTFFYAVGSTYYYRHADNGQLMGPMYPPPDIPPSTRKKVHSNFW